MIGLWETDDDVTAEDTSPLEWLLAVVVSLLIPSMSLNKETEPLLSRGTGAVGIDNESTPTTYRKLPVIGLMSETRWTVCPDDKVAVKGITLLVTFVGSRLLLLGISVNVVMN